MNKIGDIYEDEEGRTFLKRNPSEYKILGYKWKPEDVHKVYSGATGCMCGCMGNYSEKRTSIVRKLSMFSKANSDTIYVYKYPNAVILSIDNGKRNNVIYFKAGINTEIKERRKTTW